jgi:hypothetical protein
MMIRSWLDGSATVLASVGKRITIKDDDIHCTLVQLGAGQSRQKNSERIYKRRSGSGDEQSRREEDIDREHGMSWQNREGATSNQEEKIRYE